MGRVFCLGFVVSEDELLLGQVSVTSLGLSSASHVVFLQTRRSSDGPESGIAHHIWAGPHMIYFVMLDYGNVRKKKTKNFNVTSS